jgi:hypothetical protein
MLALRLSLIAAAVFFLVGAASAFSAGIMLRNETPTGTLLAAGVHMAAVALLAATAGVLVRLRHPRAHLALTAAAIALVAYVTISVLLSPPASWDERLETAVEAALAIYWVMALRWLPR